MWVWCGSKIYNKKVEFIIFIFLLWYIGFSPKDLPKSKYALPRGFNYLVFSIALLFTILFTTPFYLASYISTTYDLPILSVALIEILIFILIIRGIQYIFKRKAQLKEERYRTEKDKQLQETEKINKKSNKTLFPKGYPEDDPRNPN